MKGIYKITSPSGNVYIGQTINFIVRQKGYKNLRKKNPPQTAINRSIWKYGWENHKFEIVHSLPDDIDKDTLTSYEQFYMDQYKGAGHTMLNTCPAAGSPAGLQLSPETKRKLSEFNRGKVVSEEIRQRISATLKGRKKTPEHIAKAGLAKLGQKHSEASKELNRIKHTGKYHTEETKRKMSNSQKGKSRSESWKKQMGDVHRGKIVSQATREKLSIAAKGRKHTPDTFEKRKKALRAAWVIRKQQLCLNIPL